MFGCSATFPYRYNAAYPTGINITDVWKAYSYDSQHGVRHGTLYR